MPRTNVKKSRADFRVAGGEVLRLQRFLAVHAPTIRFPRGTLANHTLLAANDEFIAQSLSLATLERAMRQVRRPAMTIEFGAAVRCADLGIYGFVIQTAPSLLEGLERAVRFQRLITTWGRFWLERGPRSIRFGWTRAGERTLGARLVGEIALAEHVAILRELSPDATPIAVRFMHPAPGPCREHQRFFAGPIHWGADEDSVEWSLGALVREPRFTDTELDGFLLREAERRVADLPFESLLDEVRTAVLRRLPGGSCDLTGIARSLGRTPRALRRELAEHGRSFREILDEVRRERARELMEDESVSMTDIAMRLGYSELSAFSRALRRWAPTPRPKKT